MFIIFALSLMPIQEETKDEAQYWKAVDYIDQKDFESGYELVKNFSSTFTNSEWEAHAYFMKGACEVAMMENKKAINTFNTFLEKYPNAPERMITGAWRQAQLIPTINKNDLSGVAQKMEYAQRMLELGKTKGSVEIEQKKIIDLLTKMIGENEEAENKAKSREKGRQEKKLAKPSSSKSEGKGSKEGTQGDSRVPDGFTKKRTYSSKDKSDWSKLRDRERDPAFNVIKEKFPARYKELVEKYYRSFRK